MTIRIALAHTRTARWALDGTGAARGRTERAAVVLEVRTADGHVGRGEAAPLPGMSPDTLDDARDTLAALAARAPFEVDPDPGAIAALAARHAFAPSARFAIETALLDAVAAARGVPLHALLVTPPPGAPLLGLVPCTTVVDDPEAARRAVAAGASHLKIKVGPAGDLERVIAIHHAAPGALLRVDANRAWPRERTRALLHALAELPVDYVEEPCPDACALLADPLPCPIALDESLVTLAPADLAAALAAPGLAALVLKPTLLGGLAACLELASLARAAGKHAIVTHTLEGAIGRDACTELALAIALTGAEPRPVPVPTEAPRAIDPAPEVAPTAAPSAPPTVLRALVAMPAPATVRAIDAALATGRPLALLHPRLPPAEEARQRDLVAEAVLPPDAALVLFTSGSTGPARGVILSRGALAASAAASAAHLGWRADDRWLLALPLAHAGGLAVIVRCRAAGRPIALLDGGWDRARAAALLADCTLASLVPTQLAALLDDPAWRPPPRLRAVLLGGAAATPALLRDARERGVPFLTTYGLTESFGQLATAPLARAGDPDAPLLPLPGVELVAGTRAAPAPIRARGPMLATRYLDGGPIAPELVTADLGFLEDGALHVVGRRDDVIASGGEKVHPSVVEGVLTTTPGVRAACAFGVPDPRWGAVVAAALVVDLGFDERAAIAAWRAALPPHARPRELAIVEALPLGPSGKIDRLAAASAPRRPVGA